MKNKITLVIVFIIFGISCFWSELMSGDEALLGWEKKEIENFLRTAEILSTEIAPQRGRTEAWMINLFDGKTACRGYFKHVDSARPTPIADSYKYEIAAYELDKLLEIDRVPPVVEREIEGINGSLQLYLEGCRPLSIQKRMNIEPPNSEYLQNSLDEINIFENLTYCEHDLSDVLIHMDSWKVCRVDFSQAFSPAIQLIPEQTIKRCSKKLYNNLLHLTDSIIQDKLKHWLNPDEISAVLERRKIILDTITQLVKERGEESVLF